MVLVIYVYDIHLDRDDTSKLNSLKFILDPQLKIKDMGLVHYFLGLEISKHPQDCIMTQHKYTTDLLAEFHCRHFTPILTPLDSSAKLVLDMGEPLFNDPTSCFTF